MRRKNHSNILLTLQGMHESKGKIIEYVALRHERARKHKKFNSFTIS